MKTLLFDIEGTTTDINFVHKVLFPYSLERMQDFVRRHPQHPALEFVRKTLKEEQNITASLEQCTEALVSWIKTDRKHGALKEIQGEIWQQGYQNGDFKGHLYPDVLPAWKKWLSEEYQLCIYSSGSVQAQKLIFGFSCEGDLTPMISHYFDTKVGGKREVESYRNIQKTTGEDVTFFSDITEELDAAKLAGFKTVQVFRDEVKPSAHKSIRTFSEFTA
jgi:enolase-phosphatase E1